jgi:hypothetical protein
MTADPAVLTKFAEIDCNLRNMDREVRATRVALEASERVIAEARLKVQALFDRRQEIADDILALKEMLGVR